MRVAHDGVELRVERRGLGAELVEERGDARGALGVGRRQRRRLLLLPLLLPVSPFALLLLSLRLPLTRAARRHDQHARRVHWLGGERLPPRPPVAGAAVFVLIAVCRLRRRRRCCCCRLGLVPRVPRRHPLGQQVQREVDRGRRGREPPPLLAAAVVIVVGCRRRCCCCLRPRQRHPGRVVYSAGPLLLLAVRPLQRAQRGARRRRARRQRQRPHAARLEMPPRYLGRGRRARAGHYPRLRPRRRQVEERRRAVARRKQHVRVRRQLLQRRREALGGGRERGVRHAAVDHCGGIERWEVWGRGAGWREQGLL